MTAAPHTLLLNVLSHWQSKAGSVHGLQGYTELNVNHSTLHRIVQFALLKRDTWQPGVELALTLFDFISGYGYGQNWLPLFEQAAMRSGTKHTDLKCRLLMCMGELHRLNQNFGSALEKHHAAEELAQKNNHPLVYAQSLFYLSTVHTKKHEYAQANAYASSALTHFEAHKHARGIGVCLMALGANALECGDFELAKQYLNRAENIFTQKILLPHNQARVFNDLGRLYQEQESYDMAEMYYTRALEVLQEAPNRYDEAMIYTNLGSLNYNRSEFEKAERAFRQVDIDYLRATGNLYYHALTLNGLGNTLLSQDNFGEARLYLQQALQLWEQLGNRAMHANTLSAYGNLLAATNLPGEAHRAYTQALDLLGENPVHLYFSNLKSELEQKVEQLRPA